MVASFDEEDQVVLAPVAVRDEMGDRLTLINSDLSQKVFNFSFIVLNHKIKLNGSSYGF